MGDRRRGQAVSALLVDGQQAGQHGEGSHRAQPAGVALGLNTWPLGQADRGYMGAPWKCTCVASRAEQRAVSTVRGHAVQKEW